MKENLAKLRDAAARMEHATIHLKDGRSFVGIPTVLCEALMPGREKLSIRNSVSSLVVPISQVQTVEA